MSDKIKLEGVDRIATGFIGIWVIACGKAASALAAGSGAVLPAMVLSHASGQLGTSLIKDAIRGEAEPIEGEPVVFVGATPPLC